MGRENVPQRKISDDENFEQANDGWIYVSGGKDRNMKNVSGRPQEHARWNAAPREKTAISSATTFYFENFPESWDYLALWKMFTLYDRVVDLYLAKRCSKIGERFVFVRFINVMNKEGFEARLKGIIIGKMNLTINIARYCKDKTYVPPPSKTFHFVNVPNAHVSRNKSFFDAIWGEGGSTKPTNLDDTNILSFSSLEEDRSRLENCMLGVANNFDTLQNLRCILKSHGLSDCTIKYLGGLTVILVWPSPSIALAALENNILWLSQWLENLSLWKDVNDVLLDDLHV